MTIEANKIIDKFQLTPHPEGGFFRENYRSDELIHKHSLPSRYYTDRNFSTSIYYLLVEDQISFFHRLKSDEIWHHYNGSAIILHCINGDNYLRAKIGDRIDNDEFPQFVIKAGIWFAAEVENKNSYSLAGCTVAPGFDFSDFEIADQNLLIANCPHQSTLIKNFTKDYPE